MKMWLNLCLDCTSFRRYRIKPLREAISAFTGYQSTAASPPLIPHLARWRLRLASKRCL